MNNDKVQQSKFVEAAMTGNIEYIKNYLIDGDINSVDDMGITALTAASQVGQTDIVKFLLQHKEESSVASRNESFILSCEGGFIDIIRMLIDIGRVHVDTIPNIIDVSDPGIVAASRNGHVDVVKFLIQRGALVDNRGVKETHCRVFKSTALIEASDRGHFEIVKLLVQHGAELGLKANNGDTALMRARAGKHLGIVDFLIDSGDGVVETHASRIDLKRFEKLDKELASGPSNMAHGNISRDM
jgi:ankyrin repeat protein